MTKRTGLQASTRRFELYVRSSVYVLFAIEPLVMLAAVGTDGYGLPMLLVVAHAASNVLVCRWALTSLRTRARPTRRVTRLLAGWIVLTVATVAVVVVGLPAGIAWVPAFTVLMGSSLAAIAPRLRPLLLLCICLVGALLSGGLLFAVGRLDFATAAGVATGAMISLPAFAFTFWLSGWMLTVVWALEEARRSAAELAIAEERLRIARDLHDLYGRTLAAVAVKSELAAELIRRGRSEAAADEIAQVRHIADQSGRDVRQLVQGYREADLAGELAGARSLLDSAGIRCVVEGAVPPGLPAETTSALGWALREAVTNVIRHSRASECFITVRLGSELTLAVTNNGVTPRSEPAQVAADGSPDASPEPGRTGSGLVGMGERLSAIGGRTEHWLAGDRFTVEAIVPLRQPVPTGTTR